ncbi:MAG: hypothetical protein ACFFD6_04040 [Candidatus Thorarchaeota archaeon]
MKCRRLYTRAYLTRIKSREYAEKSYDLTQIEVNLPTRLKG